MNRELAASSVVLLKNDSQILPLAKDIARVALLGPNLKQAAFCGGGSAALEPYYVVSPYEAITSNLGDNVKVSYAVAAYSHAFIPPLGPTDWSMPEGKPGARMRFYREPPQADQIREVISEVTVTESLWQLMGFTHPRLENLFYADVEAEFSVPVKGTYEFGLAVYGSATLYLDDKAVIDNTSTQVGGSFFFGKGTREEKNLVELEKDRCYRLKVEYASSPACLQKFQTWSRQLWWWRLQVWLHPTD